MLKGKIFRNIILKIINFLTKGFLFLFFFKRTWIYLDSEFRFIKLLFRFLYFKTENNQTY
jgi:TM2 domain-containing membrane protein YozV